MKHKRATLVLALGITLIAASGSSAARGYCNPSGTWLAGPAEFSALVVVTVTPAGAGKFASLVEVAAFDPSFGGVLPATQASGLRGTYVRRGPRTFATQGIRAAWDDTGVLVWVERSEGTLEIEPGCQRGSSETLFHYYAPSQDPFGDEAPAFGSFPAASSARRLPKP